MAAQEVYDTVLAHYGIKGQKWHVRRYQNEDGSYTQLGKERRRVGYKESEKKEDETKKDTSNSPAESKIGKSYNDMSWLEKHNMRKKARHNEAERREKREFNRTKKEAIDSGDISFVSKNISKFSNDEINEFMTRYAMIQKVKDTSKAQQKSFVDKALISLDKASKATKSITDIYNYITESQTKKINKDKARKELDDKYKQTSDLEKRKNMAELRKAEAQARMEEWKANNPKLALKIDDDDDNKKDKSDKGKGKDKSNNQNNQNNNSGKKNIDDSDDDEIDIENERKALKKEKKAAKKAEKEARKAEKEQEEYEEKMREAQEKIDRMRQEDEERHLRVLKREADQSEWDKAVEKEREEAERAEKEFQRKALAKKQKEESNSFMNNLSEDDWNDMMYWGDRKKGLASLFNRHKDDSSDKWREKYDYTAKDIDNYTEKMLKKLQDSNEGYFKLYGSAGRNRKSQEPSYNTTRDKRWANDMKKQDYRKIDKWVDEMTEKYMKERGMSRQAAEDKAEDYVNSWIVAYDEGKVRV